MSGGCGGPTTKRRCVLALLVGVLSGTAPGSLETPFCSEKRLAVGLGPVVWNFILGCWILKSTATFLHSDLAC